MRTVRDINITGRYLLPHTPGIYTGMSSYYLLSVYEEVRSVCRLSCVSLLTVTVSSESALQCKQPQLELKIIRFSSDIDHCEHSNEPSWLLSLAFRQLQASEID